MKQMNPKDFIEAWIDLCKNRISVLQHDFTEKKDCKWLLLNAEIIRDNMQKIIDMLHRMEGAQNPKTYE